MAVRHGLIAATVAASLMGPWAIPSATGSATDVSIGSPGAVVADAVGDVYISSQTIVFKLDTIGNLTTVAGSWEAGYSGDGGPATEALLDFPLVYPELVADPVDWSPMFGGLAVDAAGELFIGDAYNNRVRKIDQRGIITTVAGTGERGHSGDGGPAINARFEFPGGVAVDSAGNLYITDANSTLRKVTPDGIVHGIVGGNCGSQNLPGLCGTGEITTDLSGNVYIPDGYCDIRKVTPDGTVTQIAGDLTLSNGFNYACGYSGDGGPATLAALSFPNGVATDAVGNLYIADTYNSCIRKVDTAGIITTIAGICGMAGFSGDQSQQAVKAQLNRPYGVAVDSAGNLYIADTANYRVRRVSTDGSIRTVAGNGLSSPSGVVTGTAIALSAALTANTGEATLSVQVGGSSVWGSPPSGTVTFTEGFTLLGTVGLVDGPMFSHASFTVKNLAVGNHTFAASYSGDASNGASTAFASITIPDPGNASPPGPTGSVGSTSGGGGAMSLAELGILLLLALSRPRRYGQLNPRK